MTGILAASELLSNKSDRGRGMSAQQIAWIEAYRQFDRPTYEQQGFGLGLAIAQQLAQIYGGQLIVVERRSTCHRFAVIHSYTDAKFREDNVKSI